MSIDFSRLLGLEIPEGVVTQIEDSSGRVLWAFSGGKAILQVEKVTSDTYAGETTYTAEEFILLDIYPKTNGTVKVTYGGLTKTITDASGVERPNAQGVFFGTFNGVSDSVATPANGELIIEGDYYAFGCGEFSLSKTLYNYVCACIKSIDSFGPITEIPGGFLGAVLAAGDGYVEQEIEIPDTVLSIGDQAFCKAENLHTLIVGKNVESIGAGVMPYMINGQVTVEVTVKMKGETPPKLSTGETGSTSFGTVVDPFRVRFVVPKGRGDVYRSEESWASYKDYITEEQ